MIKNKILRNILAVITLNIGVLGFGITIMLARPPLGGFAFLTFVYSFVIFILSGMELVEGNKK